MRRGRLLLALAAGLAGVLALAVPASAASALHIHQISVQGYPDVSVTVSTQGVAPLSTGDVRVLENGRQAAVQSVRPLGPGAGHVQVVLAIDTSLSMNGAPEHAAFAAARSFVSNLPPWVQVGVVTFARTPQVLVPLGTAHATALATLDHPPSTSIGTALYEGVEQALRTFSGVGQRDIVLLTDGHNTRSGTLTGTVADARRAHTTVYTVGFGTRPDTSLLQALASQTHGAFVPATTGSALTVIYDALAKELGQQYVVTYRSAAARGTTAKVEVQAGGASDTAVVLIPRLVGSTQPSATNPVLAFFAGPVGIGAAVGLSFLSVFAILALLFGGTVRQRRDRELARRMHAPGRAAERQPRERANPLVSWIPTGLADAGERMAAAGGLGDRVAQRLERAALPIRTGEFLVGCAAGGLLGLLIGGLLLRNVVAALVLLALGVGVPVVWLGLAVRRRVGKFQDQLPDILLVLASSLRAGHSFLQALDHVQKEIGEPAADEFARVLTEIRLGRPMDEALMAMAERIGSEDFKWAMMAVTIQRRVGGNLAEILENVAATVRERGMLRRQIKALSGEGRLSVALLVALPPLLALWELIVNPGYLALLFTTAPGLIMFVGACVLMVAGLIWMRKLIRIDV